MWRVDVPKGPIGRVRANFPTKAKAEAFFKAAKKELRRSERVDFLVSAGKLIDAIEALRMLEGISGRSKLRRAAALYKLCCEEQETKVARGYSEPLSRGIELQPGLFRALTRLAREKNVDPNDLVAGVIWRYVKEESEKVAQRYEYPDEAKVRLRDVL